MSINSVTPCQSYSATTKMLQERQEHKKDDDKALVENTKPIKNDFRPDPKRLLDIQA